MSQITPSIPSVTSAFVGRQPIFEPSLSVLGYELLFRSGTDNANNAGQGDEVSSTLMNNSLSVIGLDTLTAGKKAFFNITRQLLVSGDYSILPNEVSVIELLETVKPDAEVIRACEGLKSAGYTLALDDMVSVDGFEPLLELADIAKVDFIGTAADQRESLTRRLQGYGVRLLAEKVESLEEFSQAKDLGYHYFQGYFFCRPQIIQGQDITGVHTNYLRLLAQVSRPDVDFDELERIVKSDVSLSSKLLRYLNSAKFGVRHKIDSIKQALVLLGLQPLKKWVSLITMSYIGKDKPDELMIDSLVRGRFCEQMADAVGLKGRQFDLFMMGLLSLLDVLMSRPIEELLAEMPLAEDVKATLTGQATPLSGIYGMAIGCERVDRETTYALAQQLGIDDHRVDSTYRESLLWADQLLAA